MNPEAINTREHDLFIDVNTAMKELSAVLITIARQDERMNSMEARIGELVTRQYDAKP